MSRCALNATSGRKIYALARWLREAQPLRETRETLSRAHIDRSIAATPRRICDFTPARNASGALMWPPSPRRALIALARALDGSGISRSLGESRRSAADRPDLRN